MQSPDNKIVQFPYFSENMDSDGFFDLLEERPQKQSRAIDLILEDTMIPVIHCLIEYGIDCETETFISDFNLVVDVLRATLQRQVDIEHPLHAVLDGKVKFVKMEDIKE